MGAFLEPFRSPDIQVALGINILLAWSMYLTIVTGQLSVGHSAFMAIGGYAASIATVKWGQPLAVALVFAAAVAGLAGTCIGFPALRLRGLYLAIASLGFVFLVTVGIENWPYVGGRLGISGMMGGTPGLIWAIVLLVGAGMAWLERSRLMIAFRAVRDNNAAATGLGMNLTHIRLGGFGLGAALAGLSGGLWAHYIIFIDPKQFDILRSFEIVLFVVLGGAGSFLGPIVGAAAMTILPVWVRPLADWREVSYAVALIAMMAWRPEGLLPRAAVRRFLFPRTKLTISRTSCEARQASPPAPHRLAGRHPLLELDGVQKRFGGILAVNNASFTVNGGEVVGLVGPNGAGKSTLFDCITGFKVADAGRIQFDGRDLLGLRPHLIVSLGLQRTFQNGSAFRELTVLENLRAGQHLRSGSARNAEALELLSLADLQEQADVLAGTLSYGAQRKLEIARALAGRPRMLLLDEPAAGLNDIETAEMAALLRALVDAGLTIMVVEHHMNFVMELCDRVVVMDGGRVIAHDVPDEIARNAAVIEAYLGTPA